MSEAATRERRQRQDWAVPGSRHDKLVRFAKIGLPSAVGVLVAFLALAPLDRSGDVSFILDKKKVENAPERMRVESARYVGEDNRGQKFLISANRAVQPSSNVPIVDITGMLARLGLTQGPVLIGANKGRYNIEQQTVAVDGPVRVIGPDDYRIQTRDLHVSMKERTAVSDGPVEGSMTLGQFRADRLRADLGERKVVLDGRARLKIVQGAVR
ncbi:LPS export ABC transporter periplasmic protein LptC [Sphingomonas piscis]|uniref:LPS export ABC transporter periplasmic protein LptC n=1 Tax=Sphingomonas piscis TaxID=2714943 RepID=A0A6G7YPY0_9SPHN|nr:LPS export ABC transporter periplasmic protein LptC [Sphingomonas piscis]QIK78787.1 LPS export ABC transporter periplasmic protein LptC [Sphingomonas piscis]